MLLLGLLLHPRVIVHPDAVHGRPVGGGIEGQLAEEDRARLIVVNTVGRTAVAYAWITDTARIDEVTLALLQFEIERLDKCGTPLLPMT